MSGVYIKNMEMPMGKVATIEIHPDGYVCTLRGCKIGNAVPVEDMRPVIHSFWVYNPGDNFPYCDNCGMPQDARSDFCHSCGADMRPTSVSGAKELSKPRWIPVTEQLPENDGWYLVYAPDYRGGSSSGLKCIDGKMFCKFAKGKWSIEHGYYNRPGCVTHWMLLPEPPKEAPDA